jgi:heat shock protein HtpX
MCALSGAQEYPRVTMRRRRRPELFAPDRGLQARMVIAAVSTPAIVLCCLAGVVLLTPFKVAAGVGLAAAIGIGGTVRERRSRPRVEAVTPAEQPELHAIVDRLCVLADLPKPEIVVAPEEQPNSWLVGLSRGRARLHVTRGLLELLTPSELEAVVGHELAHLVHRDAVVMTAVGGPGAVLLDGGRRMIGGGWWFATIGGVVAAGVGWVSQLGTQALSRHRELAADAGSAALTGRPAALASALRRISGELRLVPEEDLRLAACRDVFHLLPVAEAEGEARTMTATHPPLATRIERLERLERRMQAARLTAPPSSSA